MNEFGIIILIVGIVLFLQGIFSLKKKRLVENTPTSKVRSIAMGPVEVYGKIQESNEQILVSPFSQKKCVYYNYKVEEYRSNGKRSYWATIRKGSDMIPFFINDGTGSVLVDPKGSELDIPLDFSWQSGIGKNPPKMITDFLSSEGIKIKSFFGLNKKMRFTEHILIPSAKAYVFGTAGDNPYVEDGSAKKNEEDIMISKGGKGNFFLISNKDEKNVVKRFRNKIILGFLGGSALIVIGLTITLINLGLW